MKRVRDATHSYVLHSPCVAASTSILSLLLTWLPQARSIFPYSLSMFSVFDMTSITSKFSEYWRATLYILLILGSSGEAADTYNLDTTLAGTSFFDNFNFYTVSLLAERLLVI